MSQGPSSSGCRSNVPACPQRNSSPICPLQHRGEATSVGCSGRAGRHQAGEEGMWSRAYRQRACGGKQIEAGMPRAKGRTWAPGCRGDSPQSMRCVGTAPGPCQHRGAAASKHTLPALGVPAKCMLTAEPPDNLPQGQELAAPTPSPPGSLIPLRSTDEQRGQMADCTGSLEVLGGCCLGDAVTVGQGGRAGLRLRWRRTTGPSRHTSQGDHRPHFMGLSGAEPRTPELEQTLGGPVGERSLLTDLRQALEANICRTREGRHMTPGLSLSMKSSSSMSWGPKVQFLLVGKEINLALSVTGAERRQFGEKAII